jgi:hypothetical protein
LDLPGPKAGKHNLAHMGPILLMQKGAWPLSLRINSDNTR